VEGDGVASLHSAAPTHLSVIADVDIVVTCCGAQDPAVIRQIVLSKSGHHTAWGVVGDFENHLVAYRQFAPHPTALREVGVVVSGAYDNVRTEVPDFESARPHNDGQLICLTNGRISYVTSVKRRVGPQCGVVEIRLLSPVDMDAACEVIGLAFADNPNTLAVVRGDRSRGARMMRAAARAAKLGRKFSRVLVAEDNGLVVGVLNAAQWPRCQLSVSEKLSTAPIMIREAGRGLPKSLRQMNVWAKHDPRERHWHLGPIGIHPDLQGQGVGSALLSAFLKTVDQQRSSAYLETDADRNVVLYEKFGFSVIGHAEINSVNNRFMWRPALVSGG